MIDRIHGGNVWPHFNGSGKKIIDFSANINPLGLPSNLKEIIAKNIDKLLHYPDPECKGIKKSLALFHSIPESNLFIGNGSIEIIYLILKALKPKNILIPQPTFSEYGFAARANGMNIQFITAAENNGFRINLAEIKNLTSRADLVFLCNPNNPTGSLMPKEEILSLLDSCRKNKTVLVIDEAFLDFAPENKKLTLTKEAVKNKNLLVLKSLTKFFALPGLRIGYLIGHKNIINKIRRFQYPWNVNSLAQIAGSEATKDKTYIRNTLDFIRKEKQYLFNNLSKINGIKIYPSYANFFLCKLKNSKVRDVQELDRKLIKQGILIRNCYNFPGLNNRFFRIAVRKREENNKLILALKGILR